MSYKSRINFLGNTFFGSIFLKSTISKASNDFNDRRKANGKGFILFILLFTFVACKEQNIDKDINIIPRPAHLVLKKGFFTVDKNTVINASDQFQFKVAHHINKKLQKATGFVLPIVDALAKNSIVFESDKQLKKESYELLVERNKILIKASGLGGYYYAFQSLLQLLPTAIESKDIVDTVWKIPCLEIKDKPRFAYRGLMLDVSRHFFDKDYIKKTIDALAMHKINVLHLHLVDDQGWRIEIKKYPKLTDIGAWRVDREDKPWNMREANKYGEKGSYGGFFTQKELREIVAYASDRNVEVIPEIEMPAHVTSAIASYPHLSCFNQKVGVPSGGLWPITNIYCAGKETTFSFLEDVLVEVMDIFPSNYIHIGGDEATKTNWEKCPNCRLRMRKEKLTDVEELQSYFIKRMARFIQSKGKRIIGWDEIIEGGLATDATVMSWRGVKGGLEASKQGNDVIMTPGSHCYFDHYQGMRTHEPKAIGGYTPLSKVYAFDPIVEGMTLAQKKHVLGGQANLWAEYISTNSHSQYMIFPRLAALSEALWTPKSLKQWDDFARRIPSLLTRYEILGINYAKSAYSVRAKTSINMGNHTIRIILENEFPKSDIRYVMGEKNIDKKYIKYKNPITINSSSVITASLFEKGKPVGKPSKYIFNYHKALAKKVDYHTAYTDKYKGAGAFNLVDILRGSTNFHDGRWQGWLDKDMEVTIDLGEQQFIEQVVVGAMEDQSPDIYFPTQISVSASMDAVNYKVLGHIKRAFKENAVPSLKDFNISFNREKVRYVKVKAHHLPKNPKGSKRGVWLFIDEILIK